jgi:coenzyme F420-reducing hydrogenase delta subunit
VSGNAEAGRNEPEVVVLFCQQSVARTVELANAYRNLPGLRVRLVVLPCSSNVEVRQMVKMLEKGADAIQIVACAEEACRFLVGSSKAERRVGYVRRLLDEIGFGAERVGLVRGMNLSAEQLLDRARERAELVRELGPNPMRDTENGGSPESPPQAAWPV